MQWLVTDGKLGEPTDAYLTLTAARWAGVAPWDWIGRPDTAGAAYWQDWVYEVWRAESAASKQREQMQKQRR